MEEIWRDIKDYEGYYMISSYGRVKSSTRVLSDGRRFTGKPLKINILKNGYCFVDLYKNNVKKNSIYIELSQKCLFLIQK